MTDDCAPTPRDGQRTAMLLVLTAIYGVNYVDRQILGILIEPIKHEFQLSDTQIGVLTGLAFAMFYAVMGIPMARLASRIGYRAMLGTALGLFSLATTATAFANGFWQLFAARMAVGIGEAGTTPVSLSLIAGAYPEHRRAGAMAVFTIGAQIGVLIGFVVAGLVAANFGWRAGFVAAGLPGLILIALIHRVIPASRSADSVSPRPFLAVGRELARRGDFRLLTLAASGALFMVGAAATWMPPYLARAFGTGIGEVSVIFGLGVGVWGPVATIACGRFADRLHAQTREGPLLLAAAALAVGSGAFLLCLAQSRELAAAIFLGVGLGLTGAWQAPLLARLQTLVPVAERPTATALFMLINAILGLAMGPLFVGATSEAIGQGTSEGLRIALAFAMLAPIAGALLIVWLARRSER
jgi:MFS family permease